MLHTFVALVEDRPGVLTRVASLFRRLNINIVSLTVGESERPDTSRMTIVCDAHEHAAHRIRASLYKLETTVHVDEVDRAAAVVRELCLIKIAVGPDSPNGPHSRSQIFELANVFRARVVDLAPESIMLEMTGSSRRSKGWCRSSPSPAIPFWRSRAPAAWQCGAAITPAGCCPRWAAKRRRVATGPATAVSSKLTRSSLANLKTCTRKRRSLPNNLSFHCNTNRSRRTLTGLASPE